MDSHGVLIRGGRLIDPYRGIDQSGTDVAIYEGRIVHARELEKVPYEVIDAERLWIIPRLIDMHVHFREPGQTHKENMLSGSQAAVKGGVAAVATMPNTDPVQDLPEWMEWQKSRAAAIGLARIFPIGAVTVQSRGEELADLYRMWERGARAFSDDGVPIRHSSLMRAALSYSTTLRAPIINHAEDRDLSSGASVHEGELADVMGIPGTPEAAEAIMVWRDVLLAGLTGGYLHVAHVSAVQSLEAIQYAHDHGYHVSAEVTPHHLFLTDQALQRFGYDAVTKVNPPLRGDATRQQLLLAVKRGLIEVMASDHAPHHRDEKALPYVSAPFGISGLETILATLMTTLVSSGLMTPLDAFRLMTTGPDRVLGLHYGGLIPGEVADLTLFDPKVGWTVHSADFVSQGHNTPFEGERLVGRAVATMVDGHFKMRDGEVQDAGLSSVS